MSSDENSSLDPLDPLLDSAAQPSEAQTSHTADTPEVLFDQGATLNPEPTAPLLDAPLVIAPNPAPSIDTSTKTSTSEAPSRRYASRKMAALGVIAGAVLATLSTLLPSSPQPAPPTTRPAPSTTLAPIPDQGWEVPGSSLALVSYLPTVASLRPVLSSTLTVIWDGPLPLDPSVDAASAALAPNIRAGWTRAWGVDEAEMSTSVLAYDSAESASLAQRALADLLGADVLTSRAPNPPGWSLPAGDEIVVSSSLRDGAGVSTVVLRRGNLLVVTTSRTLAAALAGAGATSQRIPPQLSTRSSAIGSALAWEESAPLALDRPPFALVAPSPGVQYPTQDGTQCVTEIEPLRWGLETCRFQTVLPLPAETLLPPVGK